MDVDPSRASLHTTQPPIIEATSLIRKFQSRPQIQQALIMARVSPIMNVRSIYSNDEEIKNLKRKVKKLGHKKLS
ncbi:AAA domain-containing protein [Psidium guajava]|nr:AAA domain-containing protein [Psidium guajava]